MSSQELGSLTLKPRVGLNFSEKQMRRKEGGKQPTAGGPLWGLVLPRVLWPRDPTERPAPIIPATTCCATRCAPSVTCAATPSGPRAGGWLQLV